MVTIWTTAGNVINLIHSSKTLYKRNMYPHLIQSIIGILLVGILAWLITKKVNTECKKNPKNCETRKRRLIGLAITLVGVGVIMPGFSWIPAGTVFASKGARAGEIAIAVTIGIGLILVVAGLLTAYA